MLYRRYPPLVPAPLRARLALLPVSLRVALLQVLVWRRVAFQARPDPMQPLQYTEKGLAVRQWI
jgi:hypothetical protein